MAIPHSHGCPNVYKNNGILRLQYSCLQSDHELQCPWQESYHALNKYKMCFNTQTQCHDKYILWPRGLVTTVYPQHLDDKTIRNQKQEVDSIL